MTEEQTEEQTEEETETTEKPGMINEAHDAAKRLEEANSKKEELLDREQEMIAQKALSGKAEAGQEPPKKKSDDEKWAEEAKERYEGTGLDPTPDNTPTEYK